MKPLWPTDCARLATRYQEHIDAPRQETTIVYLREVCSGSQSLNYLVQCSMNMEVLITKYSDC